MGRTYGALPSSGIGAGVGFHKPTTGEYRSVGIDDAAMLVMTDFKRVRALTVQATTAMQSAHKKMIANNVHLLLAVDIHNAVVGLITSTDIAGEKPVRIIQERRIGRDEVLVADVMTPREQLEAVDMNDLIVARVGHVVAMLQAVGRRHALVVEKDAIGNQLLRGLFSATQVERQLGIAIETHEVARSFAEFGEILTR